MRIHRFRLDSPKLALARSHLHRNATARFPTTNTQYPRLCPCCWRPQVSSNVVQRCTNHIPFTSRCSLLLVLDFPFGLCRGIERGTTKHVNHAPHVRCRFEILRIRGYFISVKLGLAWNAAVPGTNRYQGMHSTTLPQSDPYEKLCFVFGICFFLTSHRRCLRNRKNWSAGETGNGTVHVYWRTESNKPNNFRFPEHFE